MVCRIPIHIYMRKNERWRKINSKMFKKRQQKSSTRLCDRVVVREWVQNKSHHYIYESRTFSKGLTWCKLTITPIRRALAESINHFVFGHIPLMLTFGVVRMLYPRNTKHIHNKLRCDNNARTSNASMKERYWIIKSMHVGVKFLKQHRWTCDRDVTQWLLTPTVNDIGKSVSAKSAKMTRHSEWTPRWEKFSKMSFRASSPRNQIWEGVGLKDEDDDPERRGFQDRIDLRLGVIDMINVNRKERERKRQSETSQHISNIASILKKEYICKRNAWTCDIQKKLHHGLSLIQSYQHTINLHTSKCMIILL